MPVRKLARGKLPLACVTYRVPLTSWGGPRVLAPSLFLMVFQCPAEQVLPGSSRTIDNITNSTEARGELPLASQSVPPDTDGQQAPISPRLSRSKESGAVLGPARARALLRKSRSTGNRGVWFE